MDVFFTHRFIHLLLLFVVSKHCNRNVVSEDEIALTGGVNLLTTVSFQVVEMEQG